MTHASTLRDSPQGDVSALSIAVVGLARNCGKTLRADIHRIKKAIEGAREVQWLIVESDSTDDTVSELEALRPELRNFQFVSLGKLAPEIPKRTERISFCRNYYANQLKHNPIFSGVDYVAVADLDGANCELTREAFESSWSRKDWDVCTANQNGPYYDIWALRHKDWCPDDCWAQYRFLNAYRTNSERNLWASVHSKMITIPRDSDWIEVESAFGGFAIYRKSMFDRCEYAGISQDGEECCEHVHFHRILKEDGARIFINPMLINAGMTEHATELLWKNTMKRRLRSATRELRLGARSFIERWIISTVGLNCARQARAQWARFFR